MLLIPHPLMATKAARPDHVVLRIGGNSWTARQLVEEVSRRAAAFHSAGISKGQVVALRASTSFELFVAIHAVGWLGAVAMPLSARAPVSEFESLIARADHRVGDLPGGLALDLHSTSGCAPRQWSLSERRLVVATSGTTGRPKPISLTTMQLIISAFGSATRVGLLPSDEWINPLPLNHVGGLSILYRCAWYGTTVDLHPRFDPDAVNAALDERASMVSLVPVMLERVLTARSDRPFADRVRVILVGGARTEPSLIERCRAIRAPVSLTWGMTEAASQIATRYPGDLSSNSAPPLPFATVRAAEDGRLHVSGPLVRGELSTSDRGFLTPDGQVVIEGRADNVIISGGENIDPAEIEAVLMRHPAVERAVVVGVPDEIWGARPVAFLVGRSEGVQADELKTWCRASLSRFKVPAAFRWLSDYPRNHLGKILRTQLIEQHVTSARRHASAG